MFGVTYKAPLLNSKFNSDDFNGPITLESTSSSVISTENMEIIGTLSVEGNSTLTTMTCIGDCKIQGALSSTSEVIGPIGMGFVAGSLTVNNPYLGPDTNNPIVSTVCDDSTKLESNRDHLYSQYHTSSTGTLLTNHFDVAARFNGGTYHQAINFGPGNSIVSISNGNVAPSVTIDSTNGNTLLGTMTSTGITSTGPITATNQTIACGALTSSSLSCTSMTNSGTISAAGITSTGPITATDQTIECEIVSCKVCLVNSTYLGPNINSSGVIIRSTDSEQKVDDLYSSYHTSATGTILTNRYNVASRFIDGNYYQAINFGPGLSNVTISNATVPSVTINSTNGNTILGTNTSSANGTLACGAITCSSVNCQGSSTKTWFDPGQFLIGETFATATEVSRQFFDGWYTKIGDTVSVVVSLDTGNNGPLVGTGPTSRIWCTQSIFPIQPLKQYDVITDVTVFSQTGANIFEIGTLLSDYSSPYHYYLATEYMAPVHPVLAPVDTSRVFFSFSKTYIT